MLLAYLPSIHLYETIQATLNNYREITRNSLCHSIWSWHQRIQQCTLYRGQKGKNPICCHYLQKVKKTLYTMHFSTAI